MASSISSSLATGSSGCPYASTSSSKFEASPWGMLVGSKFFLRPFIVTHTSPVSGILKGADLGISGVARCVLDNDARS